MRLSISGRVVEIAYRDVALPTGDFIRLARKIGYDGVELRITQLKPDMPESEIDDISAILQKTGATFTRYMTWKVGDEEQWAQFVRCVGLAKRLGAESVGIWVVDVAWTKRCCDLLADHGLPLVLQVHSGPHLGTPEHCRAFLEAVKRPNLRLMYDPAHFYLNGKPYGPEVIEQFRDVIFCGGFQKIERYEENGKVKSRRLPWDSPSGVRLEEAVAGLRRIGFNGPITVIEPYDETRSPEAQMRDYYVHLRRMLTKPLQHPNKD